MQLAPSSTYRAPRSHERQEANARCERERGTRAGQVCARKRTTRGTHGTARASVPLFALSRWRLHTFELYFASRAFCRNQDQAATLGRSCAEVFGSQSRQPVSSKLLLCLCTLTPRRIHGDHLSCPCPLQLLWPLLIVAEISLALLLYIHVILYLYMYVHSPSLIDPQPS